MKKILFIKPPDRFLENEFVYQQLGQHYLESHLDHNGIGSDHLVLFEHADMRKTRNGLQERLSLDQLHMLHLVDGKVHEGKFEPQALEGYDIIGMSVMSPQAPDAYLLGEHINRHQPHTTTVIGGSHARYYVDSVKNLPENIAFDFIVPQDGWTPMLRIANGDIKKIGKSSVLLHYETNLLGLPPPTRPIELMTRYEFSIAGAPAYHSITALGCPFTCNFCESGREKVRNFSKSMIESDLETIALTHRNQGRSAYSVMFFDDVGLLNPKQVNDLAQMVSNHKFSTWRAFTHAYLVVKFKDKLLLPFTETGGKRVGMGLETGSQRTLNLINKRNGQFQSVHEHYEAVRIVNEAGIAVDAFTMIYPFEDESDLKDTTDLIRFVVANPVNGVDHMNRPLKNHVDSTIMMPYEGTKFNEMIMAGKLEGVSMIENIDPGLLFYKGIAGGSGWPYTKTRLPRERYEEEQKLRNSLRPQYR